MYSIDNFIIPVNSENNLKLRNINNIITHIIKDPYCTIIQQGNALIIKQKNDSTSIKLEFLLNTDLTLAHNILRDELNKLIININNLVVSNVIDIPKLDIKIASEYTTKIERYIEYKNMNMDNYILSDDIYLKWNSNNLMFLNKNPEIWVFHYSKKLYKNLGLNTKSLDIKWRHHTHLDGSKYPSSPLYGGTPTYYNGDDNTSVPILKHTEFNLIGENKYEKLVDFNPNEWFMKKYGIMYDNTIPYNGETIKPRGNYSKKKVILKFAIVIDGENNIPGTNIKEKIIGPLSDVLYIYSPLFNTIYTQNNILYYAYSTNEYKRKIVNNPAGI